MPRLLPSVFCSLKLCRWKHSSTAAALLWRASFQARPANRDVEMFVCKNLKGLIKTRVEVEEEKDNLRLYPSLTCEAGLVPGKTRYWRPPPPPRPFVC